MKTLAAIALAAATAFSVTACADMNDHHDHYAAGAYIDGYYDDFYGPVDDGYWGVDGGYYYRHGHEWSRDTGSHFRHEAGQGFHPMHGSGRGGTHAGGHDHH